MGCLQRLTDATSLRRWYVFNLVGFLGVGIQLATLAALHSWVGLHYLPATALAVESAVLHNFLWHERWTWADRSSRTLQESLQRLARFNLTNGAISIGSNLLLMSLLVEGLGLPYLPANLIAITTCSIANFLASDRYVFRHNRENSAAPDQGADPGPA
jgi:putative flippase GtrA